MRKFRLAAIVTLLAGSFAFAGTPAVAAGAQDVSPAVLARLTTWWHSGRADNYASGTPAGDVSASRAGYKRVRDEARVQATQTNGTKPLYLYWHTGRKDNFTTATSAGIRAAEAAGYKRVRIEGYVYSTRVSGTVPLYTYWHDGRKDNFSAASNAGIDSAEAAGYKRIRIEGYVGRA